MSKGAHTAGPWIVESVDNLPSEVSDLKVQNTYPGYRVKGICGIWNRTQTNKANAQLIAAAPEMLEAMKRAYQDLVGTEGGDWQLAQLTLREAITKAEGG